MVKYFGLNQILYRLLIKYNVRAKKIFCFVRMCVPSQRSTIKFLIFLKLNWVTLFQNNNLCTVQDSPVELAEVQTFGKRSETQLLCIAFQI